MTSETQKDAGVAPLPVALESRDADTDGRRSSPSAARNRDAILDVFRNSMPGSGTLLEIASGTGEHGAHIASALDQLVWWYSDIDAESLASQQAWRRHLSGAARLEGPVRLDVTQSDWPGQGAPAEPDALFCANMIHIAPFSACQGLLAGAGRYLRDGGRLMLYGPFSRNGEMAPSNAAFSTDLQRRNPDWGVRDLERQLLPLAAAAGLELASVVEMPANNLSVIWQKS